MTDRMPPYNPEYEAMSLSCGMLDARALHELAETVTPEDYFVRKHEVVCRAMLGLYNDSKPVDGASIAYELERAGLLDEVGGDEAVGEIYSKAPHAANAKYYAGIVKDLSGRRRLIAALEETLEQAYDRGATLADLLDAAESRIFAIAERDAVGEVSPMSDFVDRAVERIYRRQEQGGRMNGVPSGFRDLDTITDGWQPGTLIVVAARPAVGKSAFALNVAEFAASKAKTGVLFVSLEMGGLELGERIVISRSQIDGGRAKRGCRLTDEERRKLDLAAWELRQSGRFWVDDAPGRTLTQIGASARRYKSRHDIGLVILDYIQLVSPSAEARKQPRQEQVAETSRRLKLLSRELGVPIMALSQLNRESDKRADKRPMLSDLRESGAIEQDADIVILLHRPDKYKADDKPGLAEVDIAKHRAGSSEVIELRFVPPLARFESLHERPDFGGQQGGY